MVLVRFVSFFGIPVSALYVLAIIPLFFVAYDLLWFWLARSGISTGLRGIAILNTLYCILSAGFAVYHIDAIKAPGWGYILAEILLVLAIARLEWWIATTTGNKIGPV